MPPGAGETLRIAPGVEWLRMPLPFALAGGIGVLARLIGIAVAPLALAAGIVLQLAYPGDFGYTLEHGGPAWATDETAWTAGSGLIHVALKDGVTHAPAF